ncbi:hypothetical protein DOTSEDRAFT_84523 [Dothistroma septosporum NZE10]|uniref:proline--tRNA ligase n=1 Tax=Dothistroma septosporum (strain NZE10 / CBS 128990) TaxID=675120 RepID=N1PZW8_DOTSN|nr:hypothetical protein DOTSEDRAFT_84523 [Dothistroma septosporum NZE10]
MSLKHGWKTLWCGHAASCPPRSVRAQRRALHHDGRNRLSNFWTPTQTRKATTTDTDTATEDGHDLLVRAGFLRQAHSGIFHLLPLGLRVQDKIEQLIDKHMQRIGASKTSLSSLSSQGLWEKSGRLDGRNKELFQLKDRKDAKYLLAPTHEEEITTIVKNAVHSYKDLPLRLYQVSRKYRDEARPRQGLLRGREFIMKDLYTFDVTEAQAMETYEEVRAAYNAFLDDLNVPYLVANADSGNMGGSHSHEYHFATDRGEDTIISCQACDFSINEELYLPKHVSKEADHEDTSAVGTSGIDTKQPADDVPYQIWYGQVSESQATDGSHHETSSDAHGSSQLKTVVQVFLPDGPYEINLHAMKKLVPNIDTAEAVSAEELFDRLEASRTESDPAEWLVFRDPRVPVAPIIDSVEQWTTHGKNHQLSQSTHSSIPDIQTSPFTLTKARHDDVCPQCGIEGSLKFSRAVEIGHTFHLGKRYSAPLSAMVQDENNQQVEIAMGCHGIGVSRLMGAAASLLADSKGLNWPIAIAPFGAIIVGVGGVSSSDVDALYDDLEASPRIKSLDAIIDDRDRPVGWKLNDADLIGYPFIVVLGNAWKQWKAVELQCRRLSIKEEVTADQLVEKLLQYSSRL